MAFAIEALEGVTRVRAGGRLDDAAALSAQGELRDLLREAGDPVEVDLADASFLSPAWLHVLISAQATASTTGRDFQVVEYGHALTHCLEQLGLEALRDASWIGAGVEVGYFFFDEV